MSITRLWMLYATVLLTCRYRRLQEEVKRAEYPKFWVEAHPRRDINCFWELMVVYLLSDNGFHRVSHLVTDARVRKLLVSQSQRRPARLNSSIHINRFPVVEGQTQR